MNPAMGLLRRLGPPHQLAGENLLHVSCLIRLHAGFGLSLDLISTLKVLDLSQSQFTPIFVLAWFQFRSS